MSSSDKYHELSLYTLGLQDENFIHQHIVDAFTAQTADENTKDITIFFALAGLYLFVEKNYTGRQVQKAHQKMAELTKTFHKINLPFHRGTVTVSEVLKASEGEERDEMIKLWCLSVWEAYSDQHSEIIKTTEKLLHL